MHNVINLGHMKKNRDPELGCFFSIDSTNQLSLQLYSIDFAIRRREHTITPESMYRIGVIHRKPFAIASIFSADIISNRYGKSTQLNLQVTDHVFDSVVCSLQIQIQRIYKDTKFSVPKSISYPLVFCCWQSKEPKLQLKIGIRNIDVGWFCPIRIVV